MADIPTVSEAYEDLVTNLGAAGSHPGTGMMYRAEVLQAAVQLETANTIYRATQALGKTVENASATIAQQVDRFTSASDRGTQELTKWSQQTADATRGLKWATWALFAAMVIQVLIMIWTAR